MAILETHENLSVVEWIMDNREFLIDFRMKHECNFVWSKFLAKFVPHPSLEPYFTSVLVKREGAQPGPSRGSRF